MDERMKELKGAGVVVYLTRGPGNSGIQHSKTLLVDESFIIGSCNWTSSSRSNHEASVLLALEAPGLLACDERIGYLKESGRLLTDADIAKCQENRDQRSKSRGKSVPVRDMYATAKRFSIARGRSAQRAIEDAEAANESTQL